MSIGIFCHEDAERTCRAHDLFLSKHEEYADEELRLFLKLGKTCYGINALGWRDAVRLAGLGEPRIVASSLYYLRHR